MRQVAQTRRDHEPLILNWFAWKKACACAAVEGLNNQARVITRRSYGFRVFPVLETALYHTLGNLPEPELAHRFC
jgi:transposase